MSGRRSKQLMAARANRALDGIYDKITDSARKIVGGLFLEPGDPGYNRDAEAPKGSESVRTYYAAKIVEGDMKIAAMAATEDRKDQRAVAKIVLQGRLTADDWEAQAKRDGYAEARAGRPVIDVEALREELAPKEPDDGP
jgi:hypothetical protein